MGFGVHLGSIGLHTSLVKGDIFMRKMLFLTSELLARIQRAYDKAKPEEKFKKILERHK